MSLLNKFWGIIEMGYKQSVAYKIDFVVGFFATFFKMMTLAYIWMAVYRGAGTELIRGRTMGQTITYVILAQVLWSFLNSNVDVLIGFKIKHGEVAMDLVRPTPFPLLVILNNLGFTAFIFLVQSLPALVLAALVFPVATPASLGHLLLMLLSILLAFVIYATFSFSIGIIGFWTKNLWGLGLLKKLLVSTLSGTLIPLYLYPEVMKKWIYWLPFKDVVNTPIAIYQGTFTGSLFGLLANQFIWAVVFVGISQIFWFYLKRKIVVFGG